MDETAERLGLARSQLTKWKRDLGQATGRRGRPSEYSEEDQRRMVDLIPNYPSTAAAAAALGVTRGQLQNWRDGFRKEARGGTTALAPLAPPAQPDRPLVRVSASVLERENIDLKEENTMLKMLLAFAQRRGFNLLTPLETLLTENNNRKGRRG